MVKELVVVFFLFTSMLLFCDFSINDKNKNDPNNLKGKWKISFEESFDMKKIDKMEKVSVPRYLKAQNISKIGTVWYYTAVNMNLSVRENQVLILAQVDDEEEVFFNGKKIGETKAERYDNGNIKSKYDMKRYYLLPKEITNFNGKNELIIKVNNIVSDGGIYGNNIGIITSEYFFKVFLFKNVTVMEFSDWIYLLITGISLYLFLYNFIFFMLKRNWSKFYLSLLALNFAFFVFEKMTTRSIFFSLDDDIFERIVFTNVIVSIICYNQFIESIINKVSTKFFKLTQAANIVFVFLMMTSSINYRWTLFYLWTITLMIQLVYNMKKVGKSRFGGKKVIMTGIVIWMGTIIHDILYNFNIISIFNGNLTVIGFIALIISVSLNSVMENIDLAENLKELNKELVEKIETREKEIQIIQNEMIRKEKMVMLAGMGAETIHEVKNAVMPIITSVQMTKIDLEDYFENHNEFIKEEIKESISIIETAAKHANFIIISFLNYSKKDNGEVREFDINDSLELSINFLKRKLEFEGITMEIIKSSEKGYIQGEKGKIAQVFTNILMNACDALVENGRDNKKIIIRSGKEENYAVVEIEDNGPGIPDSIKDKIFEPFYTTKEEGKGTGLGMSVSLSIIKELKGDIVFESKSGIGTKFIIRIPALHF